MVLAPSDSDLIVNEGAAKQLFTRQRFPLNLLLTGLISEHRCVCKHAQWLMMRLVTPL